MKFLAQITITDVGYIEFRRRFPGYEILEIDGEEYIGQCSLCNGPIIGIQKYQIFYKNGRLVFEHDAGFCQKEDTP